MDALSHISPLLKMEAYVNGFVPSTLYPANQRPVTSTTAMDIQLHTKNEPLGNLRTSETGSPSRLSRVCSPDSTNLDFCKTTTTNSSHVGSLLRCISSSSGYIPTSIPKLHPTRDENNNTTSGNPDDSVALTDASDSKFHPHFSADFRTLRQNLMWLRRSNQQNKFISPDCEDSEGPLFANVVPAHTKVNNYELADRFSSWLKVCMFKDVPDISPFPAYLLKNEIHASNSKDVAALDFSLSKHVPCFNSTWPVKEVNLNEISKRLEY